MHAHTHSPFFQNKKGKGSYSRTKMSAAKKKKKYFEIQGKAKKCLMSIYLHLDPHGLTLTEGLSVTKLEHFQSKINKFPI